ncbi:hypothetical protein HDU97_008522 [Phlyctochytrium planicorne]|nr:hypothetical protein HDU97_008522 [Phlyctochytrium planicorne]
MVSSSTANSNLHARATLTPFHLAFPVNDLEAARTFYRDILGCPQGREDKGKWIDFNLFGHQIVAHQYQSAPSATNKNAVIGHNQVDNHNVPIPHFGIVLEWEIFHEFVDLLKSKNIKFEMEPTVRFKGLPGEQSNALEFKSFKDPSKIFATQ